MRRDRPGVGEWKRVGDITKKEIPHRGNVRDSLDLQFQDTYYKISLQVDFCSFGQLFICLFVIRLFICLFVYYSLDLQFQDTYYKISLQVKLYFCCNCLLVGLLSGPSILDKVLQYILASCFLCVFYLFVCLFVVSFLLPGHSVPGQILQDILAGWILTFLMMIGLQRWCDFVLLVGFIQYPCFW